MSRSCDGLLIFASAMQTRLIPSSGSLLFVFQLGTIAHSVGQCKKRLTINSNPHVMLISGPMVENAIRHPAISGK